MSPRRALWSSGLVDTGTGNSHLIFYATIARGEDEVRSRLARRVGWKLAHEAVIRLGIDPRDPLVRALVSKRILSTLLLAQANPEGQPGVTFEVQIDQRFIG